MKTLFIIFISLFFSILVKAQCYQINTVLTKQVTEENTFDKTIYKVDNSELYLLTTGIEIYLEGQKIKISFESYTIEKRGIYTIKKFKDGKRLFVFIENTKTGIASFEGWFNDNLYVIFNMILV